ncbi:MAG: TRZ/ATZ family hydrolase [Gammaproteobacteria bacterium]|nr:TRZ/ATZ family hydrolase [Gammaproteobacteria bacterium]MDP6733636.1 TRZ/ATZ family hydrolase [Gammaproteobacteria bacterium]
MNTENPLEADLLIHARWTLPMVPAGLVLDDHAVAIKDKKIIALCSTAQARETIRATQTVELPQHVLIPGLVNAHGHAPMALFRGVADDMPLKQWLEEHIWPLEGKLVDRQFVHEGASLAIAEMISGGITCFADMYFYPDEVAKAALDAHIRVQLASPILDFPTVWAQDADEYIFKATQLHDDFRSSDLIYTAFGPHAPYTVSDAPLQKLGMLAEELDVPIHMHVHETAQEVADAVARDGRRPLQRLNELGLITPRLLCVHATQLLDAEMDLLQEQGASVIHCPESNLKLASGFCEVAKLLGKSVNVALGTDGAASNNDLDLFSEMRTAALVAKAVADDASAVPAQQVLEMATINGAKALGIEQLIGSIEIGKFADIAAVNLDELNTAPQNNPQSHLVYAAKSSQVSHVWCGGVAILEAGNLQTLDSALLHTTARSWRSKIADSEQ